MSRLPASSIDEAAVRGALKYLKRKGEHEAFIHKRLAELVRYIRRIELDIEAEETRHIAGRRPQDRRIQFAKLAGQLEGIASELGVFLAPKTRYRQDPEFPPTHPIGLRELRASVASHFTEPLSAEYIGSFGFRPFELDPTDVSLGPVRTFNRAFSIANSAEEIIASFENRVG